MVTMRELHNAVAFIVVVVFSTEWSSRWSGLLDLREFDGSSTIKDMVNMEA